LLVVEVVELIVDKLALLDLAELVEEVLVEKQVPHKEVLELQALQILEEAEVVKEHILLEALVEMVALV
tara:strand:+ start:187 stop:393 length:207 start_codon:yes stop_codon:yes gene_type:complete